MERRAGQRRIHHAWWTLILLVVTTVFVVTTTGAFAGTFQSFVPVTLTSDRSGLIMESGAKIKLRGVQVGRVEGVIGGRGPVKLKLRIDPEQIQYIPANVQAEIRSTTAFGGKFVDLILPADPSPQRLSPGATLTSRNVSTEVNTTFENIVGIIKQLDPDKLSAVLTAVADGVRGQGERMGQAITDTDEVLQALNARTDTMQADWRATKAFGDAYASGAKDIVSILDSFATTSTTITDEAKNLDALLLNTAGFARSGTALLGASGDALVESVAVLEPTTALLLKYSPSYACTFLGAQWLLDHGLREATGGNGRTAIVDASVLAGGDDPYRYPDNLPIIAAKGGPGGKPGCGSLPDATKAYPVPYLVTNTGWGTGLDVRPNIGIGRPFWADYLPVTRAVPAGPSIRYDGPPAIGPVPYPGAPPYGAPLFGPDGTPLWAPPPPGAPPPPVPGVVNPPPPYGTGTFPAP